MTAPRQGRHVVVAGAASGAVLQGLLADPGVGRITLLTTRRFLRMPAGVDDAVLEESTWRDGLPGADHALLIYGARRREREALYWHPARADLLALATALRARGVRTLAVVVSPDLPPPTDAERQALARIGLALEQPTPAAQASVVRRASGPWPQRLAIWMIHTVVTLMQQLSATGAPRPPKR